MLVVDGWLSVGVVAQKVLVCDLRQTKYRHHSDRSTTLSHPPVFLFFVLLSVNVKVNMFVRLVWCE